MDNHQDEHAESDFEIDFIDLPPDETESFIALILIKNAHFLATAPSLLLAALSRRDTAEQEEGQNDEVEITDLPPEEGSSYSSRLITFSSQISPNSLLKRLLLMTCTLLLILLLVPGAFPSLPGRVSNLFAQPTPTPTPTHAVNSWVSIHVITETTPGVIIVGQKPTTSWTKSTRAIGTTIFNSTALLGPPPDGKNCPARPKIGFSHQVGSAPVLAEGFTGPYATLHLYPTPVWIPAFPNSLGWTASILINIQTDYTNHITLNGGDIHSGTSLLFQTDSAQDPAAFLTLDPSQATITPDNSGTLTGASWSVTMYFPAAGCYFLSASWPSSSWTINFAAGQ